MNSRTIPTTLWAAGYHKELGLYQPVPIKLQYDKEDRCWYDKSGTFFVTKPGLEKHPTFTDFSSTSKKEVETWLLGVRARFM